MTTRVTEDTHNREIFVDEIENFHPCKKAKIEEEGQFFDREQSSISPSRVKEDWKDRLNPQSEKKLELSFQEYDRIANSPNVTIKDLMFAINIIRAKAAAFARRMSTEENLIVETGLEKNLEKAKEALQRFDIIAAQHLAKLGELIAPNIKDLCVWANSVGPIAGCLEPIVRSSGGTVEGIAGFAGGIAALSAVASNACASKLDSTRSAELEGLRGRTAVTQSRSAQERQGDTAKANEVQQAIQAAQEFLRAWHDLITRILG